MPNIFEQVQQSISDPRDVGSPSGFVATSTTDSPLATAINGISNLGKLGKEIYTDIQTDKLSSELQTGLKDFVAAEEAEHVVGLSQQTPMLEEQTAEFFEGDEASPAEEVALLTDMRSRLKTWDQAFKQKRISASEFKIRMESTLKKYVNMNPSIASELRKAASSTLGFDPTGAELNQIFAQQKAAAQTSDQVQKATLDIMKKFGMINPNLSTSENVALNGQKALALQGASAQIDFQHNAANKGNMMSKALQQQFANKQSGADISAAGSSISELLQDDSISGVEKQQALDSIVAETAGMYRQKFNMLDASAIDSVIKPIKDLVQSAKDVASGKLRKEEFDNIFQGNQNTILAEFSGTPKGARYLATIKMAKNLMSIPPSVQRSMSEGLKSLAGVEKIMAESLGTDGSYSPFSQGRDLPNGSDKDFNNWFKGAAETITENADPKNPDHTRQFQNLIEGVMMPMFSDPERVQAIEYDTMLKMAGSPKFVEMIKAMPDSDRVKSKLARASSMYSTALIQKFGQEAFDNYNPEEVSTKSTFSLKEAVFGIDKERLVDITIDSSIGEFSFEPKLELSGEKLRVADAVARGFTKKYARRLNDAVKITAHLKGHTNYKGMLDQYMERTPELLFFMNEVKENK